MKKENLFKKITVILLIILLSLVSFLGIYTQQLNRIKNAMPGYLSGMDLNQSTQMILGVNKESVTKYYDAEGKETTQTEGEGITSKETLINSQELLTEENYKLSKNIITKRLNNLEIPQYKINKNSSTGYLSITPSKTITASEYKTNANENGDITVTLLKDNNLETIAKSLVNRGSFTISDSETGEILMDNSNIDKASPLCKLSSDGTSASVYLNIKFNKDSVKKLEEISKKYVSSKDEEGNDTSKKVTIKLDDEEIVSTYFGEAMTTGELPIQIGASITDEETLNNYTYSAVASANIINNGVLPITYTLEYGEDIEPIITEKILKLIIAGAIILLTTFAVYLVAQYKKNGIFAGLSLIGLFATILLVIRYTNCYMSIFGMVALGITVIFDFAFLTSTLKNEEKTFLQVWKKYSLIGVPLYIAAIVCSFIKWLPVNSFGNILFWGLLVLTIYNITITKSLIKKD